jgi:hypothetical protein
MYFLFILIFLLNSSTKIFYSYKLRLIFSKLSKMSFIYIPKGYKSFTAFERVDVSNLQALCHSKKLQEWDLKNFPNEKEKTEIEEIETPNKDFLRHQINSIKKYAEIAMPLNGKIEITYIYEKFGRLKNINPYNKSYSFTNMFGEVRNLLAYKDNIDIDIVNCHFKLFYNKCILNDIPCKNLKNYIDNRDDIFKEIIDNNPEMKDKETKELVKYLEPSKQRKILKAIFTSLLNNGKLETQTEQYNITDTSGNLEDLYNELQGNITKIINLEENKEESEYIRLKKIKQNDTTNIKGSQIASILQTTERNALFLLTELIEEDNFEVGARIHDGCHIVKNKNLEDNLSKYLEKWSIIITKQLYNLTKKKIVPITLVCKEMEIDESFLIPDDKYIQYLYQKKMLEDVWGLARINNTGEYISFERAKLNKKDKQIELKYYSSINEIHDFFKNKCQINGKSATYQWILDPHAKEYERVEFNPHPKMDINANIYNTFSGLNINDYNYNDLPTTQIERENEIMPLLKLIKMISGNNEKQFFMYMVFTSSILAKPYKKVKMCPVSKGSHGVGKNTYLLLMKELLGDKYVCSSPDISKFFGHFNKAREHKLLVCINEANFQETSKVIGVFKDAITEDTYFMEKKGIDPIEVKCFANFFTNSNNFQPIQCEKGQRRFYLVKIDDIGMTQEEKKKFFDIVYREYIGDKDHKPNYRKLKIFYEYLLQWYIDNNIDNFDIEDNIQTSESKNLEDIDPLDEWIQLYVIPEVQSNNYLQSLDKSATELMNSYIEYCKIHKFKYDSINSHWATKHLCSKFDKFICKRKTSLGNKICINIDNFLNFFKLNRDEINDIIISE